MYSPAKPNLTIHDVLVAFDKIALGKTPGRVILNLSWGASGWAKNGHDMADALAGLVKLGVIPVVGAGNDSVCRLGMPRATEGEAWTDNQRRTSGKSAPSGRKTQTT